MPKLLDEEDRDDLPVWFAVSMILLIAFVLGYLAWEMSR